MRTDPTLAGIINGERVDELTARLANIQI